MPRKSFFTNSFVALRHSFSCLIISALLFLNISDAYALNEGVRNSIGYSSSSYMCSIPMFPFDPFSANDDINFVVSNPTCATYIATTGTVLLATLRANRIMCKAKNPIGLAKVANETAMDMTVDPPVPYPSPNMFVGWIIGITNCTSRLSELSTLTAAAAGSGGAGAANAALASTDAAMCCGSTVQLGNMVAIATSVLAALYGVASETFKNARICGHDWNIWAQTDTDGNIPTTGTGTYWTKGNFPGSHRKCLDDAFLKSSSESGYNSCGFSNVTPTITNQYYREFIFGGREFEDNGSDACTNPASLASQLGYTSTNQRYYMTGPGGTSVFACHRFLISPSGVRSAKDIEEATAAYECCKARSQNTICIENKNSLSSGYDHKFCSLGSKCSVAGVVFEAYASKAAINYICAKTYSLCPYDHLLGGGTEIKINGPCKYNANC